MLCTNREIFMNRMAKHLFPAVATLLCVSCALAQTDNLRVGAAKIDVTPSAKAAPGLRNVWGTAYTGIHDHIYVRGIVLDNGKNSAALLSIDTSSMPDTLELRRRIEKETGVPAGSIMISTTHTHNAPAVGAAVDGRQGSPQAP